MMQVSQGKTKDDIIKKYSLHTINTHACLGRIFLHTVSQNGSQLQSIASVIIRFKENIEYIFTGGQIGKTCFIQFIDNFSEEFASETQSPHLDISAFYIQKMLKATQKSIKSSESSYDLEQLFKEKTTCDSARDSIFKSLNKLKSGEFLTLEDKERKKALKACISDAPPQTKKPTENKKSPNSSSEDSLNSKQEEIKFLDPLKIPEKSIDLDDSSSTSDTPKISNQPNESKKTELVESEVITTGLKKTPEETSRPSSTWTFPKIFGLALLFLGIGSLIYNRYFSIRNWVKNILS